ncbi:MAG: DNA methyltransferase [Candidatus Hodarchaeota archaeon]
MPPLSLKSYQEDRQERGVYDKRNPLNDLTGKEWLFSTKTILPKKYPLLWPSNLKSRNLRPIPSGLSTEIIETFSKPGDTILDPFAGIGSTLIGCFFTNDYGNPPRRNCIGIENKISLINQFYQLAQKLNVPTSWMLKGEPISLLSEIKKDSIGLICCDIPIWDISDPEEEESVAISLERFIQSPENALKKWLSSVFKILSVASNKLKESKYLIIGIPHKCFRGKKQEKMYPNINFTLSSILAYNLQKIGLTLKAERIWFIPGEKEDGNFFRPLNRRFLIFRKEKVGRKEISDQSLFFKKQFPIGSTAIIHKSYPPSYNHKLRSQHGGMKPPELAQLLIEKYSKKRGDLVLDPFAGVGGTLLGASLAQRRAVGIDINKRWKNIYLEVSQEANLSPHKFLIGDSRQLIGTAFPDETIDLILTDVPYWAMDKLKKTRGRFSKAGEHSKDKIPSPLKKFNQTPLLTIEEWLVLLNDVFSLCHPKLINGRYLVVFIGNMYRTIEEMFEGKKKKVGKYLMLSSMLTKLLLKIGYKFEHELIWYAPDKALHVFGYPFSYIPSIVHQSILVFKK